MKIESCIPVIPSLDIEKSLRSWVDGIGLIAEKEMRDGGKLIGCMVHNDKVYFWLNSDDKCVQGFIHAVPITPANI